jgi:hypothetical protein
MSALGRKQTFASAGRLEQSRLLEHGGFNANNSDISYGLNELRLRDSAEPEAGVVVFTRHGLSWKLTDIRIPTDAMSRGRSGAGTGAR